MHRTLSPTDTETVDPSAPVPVIVGVVSRVPLPSAGDVITGELGSTVTCTGAPTVEFPAASTAVGVSRCGPAVSVGVHDHTPSATVAVQSPVVPSATVTVEPSSPVPLNVGVAV